MPLPLLALGAIGLASSLPKFYAAYQQNKKASQLKLQDSTTNGEREQLAMSRQGVNAQLPGLGAMQGRLAQVQAGAVQNARLGAASGSDYLAAAGAADARRQQGEQQLGIQGQQYQDGMKRQLRTDLGVQSARQQRDLDTYNSTKAALEEGSARNFDAGVQSLASYAAAGVNSAGGGGAGGFSPPGMGGDYPSPGPDGHPYGNPLGGSGRYRRSRMGINGYA